MTFDGAPWFPQRAKLLPTQGDAVTSTMMVPFLYFCVAVMTSLSEVTNHSLVADEKAFGLRSWSCSPAGSDGDTMVFLQNRSLGRVFRGTGALITTCSSRRPINGGCVAVSVHGRWSNVPVVRQKRPGFPHSKSENNQGESTSFFLVKGLYVCCWATTGPNGPDKKKPRRFHKSNFSQYVRRQFFMTRKVQLPVEIRC